MLHLEHVRAVGTHSQESVVGLMGVGRSDPAASGLNAHATFRERAYTIVRRTGLGFTACVSQWDMSRVVFDCLGMDLVVLRPP
jgi:hypothetical protein